MSAHKKFEGQVPLSSEQVRKQFLSGTSNDPKQGFGEKAPSVFSPKRPDLIDDLLSAQTLAEVNSALRL